VRHGARCSADGDAWDQFDLHGTSTHSCNRCLYKCPQAAFRCADLVDTHRQRSKLEVEYERLDAGVSDDNR